jgi:hypothetical protein
MKPALCFGVALACLFVFGPAVAQVPPEVSGVQWCAGAKDCLSWTSVTGATTYHVYRGSLKTMTGLINTATDSCVDDSPGTTTTGHALEDTPDSCELFWYLVTASNISGEGTSGSTSLGARQLNEFGLCLPACAADASTCASDADCCSGRCASSACAAPCCKRGGATCVTAAECCSGTCSGGVCGAEALCAAGNTNCNGTCANLSSDVSNCGGCGAACSSNHNLPSCSSGNCFANCFTGFADCDGNARVNGCETDVNSDPNSCGGCSAACSSNHMATRTCGGGNCNGACAAGFADCNGNKRNDGCEIDLTTDANNCGACGTTCSSNHMATRTCGSGTCNGTCASGFLDCNGNKQTDGCEINTLTDPDNCGGCGIVCSSNHMATRTCSAGVCNGTCAAGFADCDGNKQANGCEINLGNDPNNCSACGFVCDSSHSLGATCNGASCVYASCAAGYANCSTTAPDTAGCECHTPACCGSSCQNANHNNGVGQQFFDCLPTGTPGNGATYSLALATDARAAWTTTGTDSSVSCGGLGALQRTSPTGCAVWVYQGSLAGYVRATSNNFCFCPTVSDQTWY